jgi:tape measure domain-containing protein
LAIIRELITVLGTEFDPKGVQQYEKGIARVKELTTALAATLGLVFSVDKIIEFADGLVTAGKEVNRLTAQLKAIARPMDDMNEAQQQIFETAQRVGVSYKETLGTFREFYGAMKDSKASQDEIVTTTENIYKALRVGRASAEEMNAAMETLSRSFRRGAFRSVALGALEQQAPIVLEMLQEHFKTNMQGLRDLAKQGKITADVLTEVFGHTNAELDEKFSKVPVKLNIVFTRIYNDLVNVTAQIYKLTEASEFMGKIVWWVWTRITGSVKELTNAVGGLKNLVQLLGIALAVALGPWLLTALATVIGLTIRWTAANAVLLLQWTAMALAVAAVAIAIQDLIFWMQGKESIIGTWVGPFDKLAENFKKLDIFSGFRSVSDLFKGDWTALSKDFKIFTNDLSAQILAVTGLVGLTFVAWQVISFVKLIAKIVGVKTAVAEVEVAAKALQPAFAGANAGATTLLGTLGRISLLLAAIGFLYWAVKPTATVDQATENKGLGLPEDAGPFARRPEDKPLELDPSQPVLPMSDLMGGSNAERKKSFHDWMNRKFGWTGMHFGPRQATDASLMSDPAMAMWLASETQGPAGMAPMKVEPRQSWIGKHLTSGMLGTAKAGEYSLGAGNLSAMPSVAPGAIAGSGPVTNNTDIKPVFNQNVGSINVTTMLDADQIGKVIGDKVGQLAGEKFDAFARSLTTGNPRVEAATQ